MKRLLVMCVASVLSISTLAFASSVSESSELYQNLEEVKPYALTPPTALSPHSITHEDWSGTKNYTYTNYYFKPGIFETISDGSHKVEFYTRDGRHIKTSNAEYIMGSFQVNESISEYYYAKLFTIPTGKPSENSFYTASYTY